MLAYRSMKLPMQFGVEFKETCRTFIKSLCEIVSILRYSKYPVVLFFKKKQSLREKRHQFSSHFQDHQKSGIWHFTFMDCGLHGFGLVSSNHWGSKQRASPGASWGKSCISLGAPSLLGRGGAGLRKWAYGRTYRVPVPGTRYLLCTVKRTIM